MAAITLDSLPIRTRSEAVYAEAVARHLGTDRTELYVEPDHALDLIPALADRYDEPFGDSSHLPTLLVSELVRRHVIVALSGDRGDELFAGYNRYAQAGTLRRLYARSPGWVRKATAGVLTELRPQIRDRLSGLLPAGRVPRLLGDKLHVLAEAVSLDRFDEVYPRLVSHWALEVELVPGGRGARTLPRAHGQRAAGAGSEPGFRSSPATQARETATSGVLQVPDASFQLRGACFERRIAHFGCLARQL